MNRKRVKLTLTRFTGCVILLLAVFYAPIEPSSTQLKTIPASESPVTVPVCLIIYGSSPSEILPLAQKVMTYLERGTRYHREGAPYLDFKIAAVASARQTGVPVLPGTGKADYEAIYSDNGIINLCAWAQDKPRAQIWVWEDGTGGIMKETVDNGPAWHNPRGTNVPDCGVQVATLSHNYTRAVADAVESHIHRYEQAFSARYSYAFNRSSDIPYHPPPVACLESAPYRQPVVTCPGSAPGDPWGWCVEDFLAGYHGVPAASPAGYTGGAWDSEDVAQCGWAHYPPNITWEYRQAHGDASRYIYDYHGTVRSNCTTWRLDQDPALTADVLSCTAWGCDRPGNDNQAEFFVWWMQNIPGPDNTNYDEDGKRMDNWWALLYP